MRVIAVIPIKKNSERIPGKNFRIFAGRPLYEYIIENAKEAKKFDEIFVDTDSAEIKNYSLSLGCTIIERPNEFTSNRVNGNDLLNYELPFLGEFDFVFQLFATAPLLSSSSIARAVGLLTGQNNGYDSCFTVTEEVGWFWFNNLPVNYRTSILPRSQDAPALVKESTGLYGISRQSLIKYRSRIGAKPLLVEIPKQEALDIDDEFDFKYAEQAMKYYEGK